jgi:2-keto-4-pentenoate hydratase/2-oxohepta-3-ene-1,7-dioic acid hydratase in catechol pathway
MRLCMFHPVGHPLERGWVGRVDGERVIQLAAQTLQSLFTGGGTAREHAEYPLHDVVLLAPVLHPPSIRIFDDQSTFAFANPAAVVGPGAAIRTPSDTVSQGRLAILLRIAGVIGAGGTISGYTGLAEWQAPGLRFPKDRDFALGLGPVVVTHDEFADASGFDWPAATALAAAGTLLHAGDILAGPAFDTRAEIAPGESVALQIDGIGVLEQRVAG